MIHVYGVVDGLAELPALSGLDDAPLQRRRVAGLEVVLSETSTPPATEVTREAVLRHAHVVEELLARSDSVLPAQLGRAFRTEQELAEALRSQASQLERGLDRVRGCVEFGLRAVREADSDHPQTESGVEYMRLRLEAQRRREQLVAQLHEPLARLARATTSRGQGEELNAAYLVARADVPAFREAVARFEHSPGVTVVCTGPWPPYSFAAEAER